MRLDPEGRPILIAELSTHQIRHEEAQILRPEDIKLYDELEVVHAADGAAYRVGVVAVGMRLEMTAPDDVTPRPVEDPAYIIVERTSNGSAMRREAISLRDKNVVPTVDGRWNPYNYLRRLATQTATS